MSLTIPRRDPGAQDRIARRMTDTYAQAAEAGAVSKEEGGDPNLIRDPWQPRWRIDSQWVEFECGCRCERIWPLRCEYLPGDAVIFQGLPEQAVYDYVCDRHAPGMNMIVKFSGFADFGQWKRTRKHLLLGRTA